MVMIGKLLGSKKFIVSLAGAIVVVLEALGVPIGEDTVHQLLVVVAAYVVGQGIADAGKSAAIVTKGTP
jgi:hypothetical protein